MSSTTQNPKKVNSALKSPTISNESSKQRIVIAIDYGTTFTGVAIAIIPVDQTHANLEDIWCVDSWGDGMENMQRIPSLISYTLPTSGELQWGSDLSSNAVVMAHTKLELDVQDSKADELDRILHHLDGMHDLSFDHVQRLNGKPDYSPKKPDNIIEDYLKRVFTRVIMYLEDQGIGRQEQIEWLVDIVFTVPMGWSYAAKNATYRAITGSGFNESTFPKLQDILLLTEPEAAAVYTARALKDQSSGVNLLREGECFIVCDAGGGTVDVVTFRVVQLQPILELERVGIGKSAKCGSAFIDGAFKLWLRDTVLDQDTYNTLEPNIMNRRIKAHAYTSETMMEVMRQFVQNKARFTGLEPDDSVFRIYLPAQLNDLTVIDDSGSIVVDKGELNLVKEDMKYFFEEPLNRIVELVVEQAMQAEVFERRVKNIFIVGGLGESRYVQATLRKAMEERHIAVYQPDTNWTAVVRGAALHGIEKHLLKSYVKTQESRRYYGFCQDKAEIINQKEQPDDYVDSTTGKRMAKNQMTWVVNRGDLILPSSIHGAEKILAFSFRDGDEKVFTISIYEYLDDDEYPPMRLKGARSELEHVLDVPISFEGIDLSQFAVIQGPNGYYYQASVTLKMHWNNSGELFPEVAWNGEILFPSVTKLHTRSTNISSIGSEVSQGLASYYMSSIGSKVSQQQYFNPGDGGSNGSRRPRLPPVLETLTQPESQDSSSREVNETLAEQIARNEILELEAKQRELKQQNRQTTAGLPDFESGIILNRQVLLELVEGTQRINDVRQWLADQFGSEEDKKEQRAQIESLGQLELPKEQAMETLRQELEIRLRERANQRQLDELRNSNSPAALRELRELIRARHELDLKIWRNRDVLRANRPMVERMMIASDAILQDIRIRNENWEKLREMGQDESGWSPEEWKSAEEIMQRLLSEGKREWTKQPPWSAEDNTSSARRRPMRSSRR